MRYERVRRPPHAAQHAGEQRRPALAIHIVVTVHQDRSPAAHRARHQLHGDAHVDPIEGIGEALELGPQECLGEVGRAEPALHQDGGEGLGDVELAGQRGRQPGVRPLGDRPAGRNHSLA